MKIEGRLVVPVDERANGVVKNQEGILVEVVTATNGREVIRMEEGVAGSNLLILDRAEIQHTEADH